MNGCLSLKPDAYAIWQRAEHKLTNWEELRAELEEAFEDSDVRTEWQSNMKAFVWDEVQPLRVFRAKVERYVDTFDKVIANNPTAKKVQYYLRFVNGLPSDYYEYIILSMPSKCTDINKALEACLRFQSTKKRKSGASDIGASAAFGDTTASSRITQNENGIRRLEEKLKKLRKHIPVEVTYVENNIANEDFSNDCGLSSRSRPHNNKNRLEDSHYGDLRRGKSFEKGLLRRSETVVEESSTSTDYEDEA